MRPNTPPDRLQLLALAFISAVIAVLAYSHQLVVPIFLGLLTWGKVWLKSLTPKLGLLLLKNSAVMQLRRIAMQVSTHLFVKSHRPWRRFITRIRIAAFAALGDLLRAYLSLPLWLRTAIAIGILVATAGSSFAVFALLIIPQPLLDWLRVRAGAVLNRLGVSQVLTALWKALVPGAWRHRLYIYVKWTLGRQQVAAARKVHERVVKSRAKDAESGVTADPANTGVQTGDGKSPIPRTVGSDVE
ncbi:MAG: hypothetical protein AAGI72_04800 [Pseudomonadota bacterium]